MKSLDTNAERRAGLALDEHRTPGPDFDERAFRRRLEKITGET
jgi:hypothetical protein